MRKINSFVITRTDDNLPSVVDESFRINLKYPYPHYYIFKGDDSEDDYQFIKTRPLSERCANVRDSLLNNTGIGIVIKTNTSQMNEKLSTFVANLIKFISEDLGIDNFSIVSNEIDSDKFIDTYMLDSKISLLPSPFSMNPNIK